MKRSIFNSFDAYSKWEAEKEEEEYQRYLEEKEQKNKESQVNEPEPNENVNNNFENGIVKNPEPVSPSTTTQFYEKDGQLSFFPIIEKQKKKPNKKIKHEDEEREI